jgi:molecular chaperone DnaK
MATDYILGIDLGTTNSLVGVVDSGFPIILADSQGQRSTPSAVHFGQDGNISVGHTAQRQRITDPARVVTSVKRLMGRRAGESEWQPSYDLQALGQSPVDVSAAILRHLRWLAEAAMDCQITRAVITVPAFFNDAQRTATKMAGEMAGLQVERILAEPTAAALAYGLDKLDEQRKIAVFDLGGGTFDISILEMREGVFQVLATAGDTQLGGDDLDHLIAQHLWAQLPAAQTTWFAQLPNAVRGRLLDAAQTCKVQLSSQETAHIALPFLWQDDSLATDITRADLDSLATPWLEKTRAQCWRAMTDAKVSPTDLDDVLLVGGSTRMPLVRRFVAALFQCEPNTTQNPDEAIAQGAIIQAGMLSGALRQIILLDVTPLSLGIETFGGLMNIIIPRNTTLPCKAGEVFTNAVANQDTMLIRVLQGEREVAKDNWELGRIHVPFPAGPKGSARVGVQYSIDINGILQVLARDTSTGKDTILEIQNTAVDVDDARVEAMISESVEFAFEDMNERIWTEASLKANELLPAVAEALHQLGDAVSSTDRQQIDTLCAHIRSLLLSDDHDARKLKTITAELDAATQSMAVLLVEQAMDEALDRRLGLTS